MACTTPALEELDGQALVRWSRACAGCILGGHPLPSRAAVHIVGSFGGVFVTFWHGSRLRGCVGRFATTDDLAAMVSEVTGASLKDQRFADDPITLEELGLLRLEISVLSDLFKRDDPLSIRVGTDGVVIRCGTKSGCFLPKVALEQGWSVRELLARCCTTKAGLSADAWQSVDVDVYTFTAQVFSEGASRRSSVANAGNHEA